MIERAKVQADWACPPHDLPAITALIAVAENHSSFLVRVAVLPRPRAAAHDFLARLDVDELLVRKEPELPLALHLNPREQACTHRSTN